MAPSVEDRDGALAGDERTDVIPLVLEILRKSLRRTVKYSLKRQSEKLYLIAVGEGSYFDQQVPIQHESQILLSEGVELSCDSDQQTHTAIQSPHLTSKRE